MGQTITECKEDAMSHAPRFVGIDVSKAQLDVAVLPGAECWTETNDEAGISTLVSRLQEAAPALVVLEATGGYESAAVAILAAAGLPVVVVVNPRQVRDFAKATGQLAKTDQIDAGIANPAVKRRITKHLRWLARELSNADRDLDGRSGTARSGGPTRPACTASLSGPLLPAPKPVCTALPPHIPCKVHQRA